MKVIILAAGEGTRMRPLTENTPKSLINICGITIAERIFDSLPDEVDEVVIVVNYLKEKIKDYLGSEFKNKKIQYVEQGEKKGTFGALLSVKNLIKQEERFLVLNCDDIHDKKELEEYLKYPRSFGIQKMIMPNYYNIKINNDGFVEGFEKQNEEEKMNGAMVATGVYVLDANIFNHPGVLVHGGEYGLPQTILDQKNEFPVKAVETTKWIPVNTFDDLKKAEDYFKK